MNDRHKIDDPHETLADYVEQAAGALSIGNLPRAVDLVLKELRRMPSKKPAELLELLLFCPRCKEQHIDEGEFATRAHKDHACQHCGLVWRPCKQPSVGVQFFTGYKNSEPKSKPSV